MTESNHEPETFVEDRRQSAREPSEAEISVRLDAQALIGRCDNISPAGVLFFSEDKITVTITIDGPDGPQELTGHLARVQRMSESTAGFAIEFDEE